ncbi:MAG TPA: hypothetical protein VFS00_28335, partial [Polyangiaceae bacterium]|nr:hypothetical protein [Polyangiaceae bacterium]
LASAELLARFGLLDATRAASIRSGTGYLDTANDLTALAAIFHAAWPEVASKSIVTIEEVNRAAELGPRLVGAIGRRQQGTDGAGEAGEAHEQLARAYTLFFNAYDECRRGVAFVRWREGDADAFAPTLRPAARRPRPSDDVPVDDEAPKPEPGGEVPGEGAPGGRPGGETPGGVPGGRPGEGAPGDRPGSEAPGGGPPHDDLPADPGV